MNGKLPLEILDIFKEESQMYSLCHTPQLKKWADFVKQHRRGFVEEIPIVYRNRIVNKGRLIADEAEGAVFDDWLGHCDGPNPDNNGFMQALDDLEKQIETTVVVLQEYDALYEDCPVFLRHLKSIVQSLGELEQGIRYASSWYPDLFKIYEAGYNRAFQSWSDTEAQYIDKLAQKQKETPNKTPRPTRAVMQENLVNAHLRGTPQPTFLEDCLTLVLGKSSDVVCRVCNLPQKACAPEQADALELADAPQQASQTTKRLEEWLATQVSQQDPHRDKNLKDKDAVTSQLTCFKCNKTQGRAAC